MERGILMRYETKTVYFTTANDLEHEIRKYVPGHEDFEILEYFQEQVGTQCYCRVEASNYFSKYNIDVKENIEALTDKDYFSSLEDDLLPYLILQGYISEGTYMVEVSY